MGGGGGLQVIGWPVLGRWGLQSSLTYISHHRPPPPIALSPRPPPPTTSHTHSPPTTAASHTPTHTRPRTWFRCCYPACAMARPVCGAPPPSRWAWRPSSCSPRSWSTTRRWGVAGWGGEAGGGRRGSRRAGGQGRGEAGAETCVRGTGDGANIGVAMSSVQSPQCPRHLQPPPNRRPHPPTPPQPPHHPTTPPPHHPTTPPACLPACSLPPPPPCVQVLPLLFPLMAEGNADVCERTCYALDTFCEALEVSRSGGKALEAEGGEEEVEGEGDRGGLDEEFTPTPQYPTAPSPNPDLPPS